MKSLYNKSGILPALFMNSRVDCGIAWSEHRSQCPAGHRKTSIKLHVYCDSEAIGSVYEKAVSAIEGFKKAITETLKPIDPQTIKVGDPGRTVVIRNARKFGSKRSAEIALRKARGFRPFKNATIQPWSRR